MAVRGEADSVVFAEGPWTHRDVHANGTRFHVVEAGAGPLILLLHGFPQLWWAWRAQIPALADAGYRVVAADLRGYGGSDKPPRGYDAPTLAADVAGLVRALGERDAVIVGHDWGGHLGFVVAALHPDVVRRLVVLSIAHPLRMRNSVLGSRRQAAASRYVFSFQAPWLSERRLLKDDAALVAELFRTWAGPSWRDPDAVARYRTAISAPGVAHSALEYYRWAVRSTAKPEGARLSRALREPIAVPVLQLHGALDSCVLPDTARGSGQYVAGPYVWRQLDGVGHFLPEEAPDIVTGEVLAWAKEG
jgi:pimeloyl-ACP methyl ester carboxylesterase